MTGSERRTYELRLNGPLGSLLLASVPHAAATQEPRHTLVFTHDDATLRKVVQRLVDAGVELESVRQVTTR